MNSGSALGDLVGTPLFGVTLTVVAYWLADRLWRATGKRPLLHPVLVAIILGGAAITLLSVPYDVYLRGGAYIAFLLGPATVALALPLHRQAATIARSAPMVVVSVSVGAAAAIVTGYSVTRGLGAPPELALSMAPKSATTPIAIALATQIGGVPAIAAVLAVSAGILGATVGSAVLTLLRIHDPRVRGLSIGVASHGVGTARMLQVHDQAGAFSGVAMGLSGLATSLFIGPLLALLGA